MANPVLIAAPIAIVPTVLALWYLLKRYEQYFDDGRVFITLTFGFFAGLLAIFLEFALFPFQDPLFKQQVGPGTAFLMFIIGYSLFETGIKLVILGSKRYRARKDTPYYAAALGLGMGAMMGMGFIAINLNAVEAVRAASNVTANVTVDAFQYQTIPFLAMVAVPVGGILAHGGSAVYVGRYVSKGALWKAWLIGAALQMPATLALALFWPGIGVGFEAQLGPGIISLAYGLGLLWIARSKVLDHVVPKEVLDRLNRAKRREARAEARGEEVDTSKERAAAGLAGAAALGAKATKEDDGERLQVIDPHDEEE